MKGPHTTTRESFLPHSHPHRDRVTRILQTHRYQRLQTPTRKDPRTREYNQTASRPNKTSPANHTRLPATLRRTPHALHSRQPQRTLAQLPRTPRRMTSPPKTRLRNGKQGNHATAQNYSPKSHLTTTGSYSRISNDSQSYNRLIEARN